MVEQGVRELLDVLFRWVHLIAGIMWIGNSLLFNWLDRNLIRDDGADDRHVGRIWLLHSGGFYDVEKKSLAPRDMPAVLHWFKWQAYTTWMSGVALLVLLYWTGGATLMIDPGVAAIGPAQAAVGIGVGVVVGGWVVYDGIWRILGRFEPVAIALSIAALAAVIWGLTHVLSGRAAFLHVGAMLGTCMAGNVAMHIIPSQRRLVAATREGRPQDLAVAKHAKQRSIHNNYMTFPLLFTMLSNHFSSLYGSRYAWLLLGVLFVGGALVRHWLNVRFTFRAWMPALAATVLSDLRRRRSLRSATRERPRMRPPPRRTPLPWSSRRSSSCSTSGAHPATPTTRRSPRILQHPLPCASTRPSRSSCGASASRRARSSRARCRSTTAPR